MIISKEGSKIAKLAFKASLTNDKVDQKKVGKIVALLLKQKPKGLLSILKSYSKLLKNKYKYQTALIEGAIDLSKSDLAKISMSLNKSYKSDLDIKSKTNPDLLAGVKIKIGDTILDYSIKGQLQNLRKDFL